MEINLKQEHSVDTIPKIIPVVPTINVTVFPNMIMPLLVLDERIMNGIKQATNTKNYVLLLSAQESEDEGQEVEESLERAEVFLARWNGCQQEKEGSWRSNVETNDRSLQRRLRQYRLHEVQCNRTQGCTESSRANCRSG